VALAALYAVFLVAGMIAARRARGGNPEELMIAGRALPLWLAVLTMTATWVDGGYLLGTAEGVYRSSLALGAQGGVCFGLSLILGGLFFARRMRRLAYTTLIDPFEDRYGGRWAALLALPALGGEIFWSAELMVAIGSTFGVALGMRLETAILLSAAVIVAYTVAGGLWSVAYTDALQLALVVIGLLAVLPFALAATGGIEATWRDYLAARSDRGGLLPAGSHWTPGMISAWWDTTAMLVCGGIPWNCYFQRVLSCRTPDDARSHSIIAGLLTIALVAPPLLMGVAAFNYAWPEVWRAQLEARPALALPRLIEAVAPPAIALLGFGAIVGAVTSSFSASVLSAASMASWNGVHRLWRRRISPRELQVWIRLAIVVVGAAATLLALRVQSVQALWFFTSDLVFVLLFPQLICALYDPRANRPGSIAAFFISLILRLGGGEPLFNLPALIPYPETFPFKTAAAVAGLLLLPFVSRLTAKWSPPRPLAARA
jgi:high affinity choline transporter 7